MNDIVQHQSGAAVATQDALGVKQIVGRIDAVKKIMKGAMREADMSSNGDGDGHYGVIPGTKKKTLLKPGADMIMMAFQLATEVEVQDLGVPPDEYHFRVTATLIHTPTGLTVGQGVGSCSTEEEKYAWRAAACDAEFDDTDPGRRRLKYFRNGNKVKQIRTNAADLANTVLKMAKKRAVIDAVIACTAAGEMFTQDAPGDGAPEDWGGGYDQQQAPRQPQRRSSGGGNGVITQQQGKLLWAKLNNTGKSADDLCEYLGVAKVTEIPKASMNDALEWIGEAE